MLFKILELRIAEKYAGGCGFYLTKGVFQPVFERSVKRHREILKSLCLFSQNSLGFWQKATGKFLKTLQNALFVLY